MSHELPSPNKVSPAKILPNTARESSTSSSHRKRSKKLTFINTGLAGLQALSLFGAVFARDTLPTPSVAPRPGIATEKKPREVRSDEPKLAGISLVDSYPVVPTVENRQPTSKPFLSETAKDKST